MTARYHRPLGPTVLMATAVMVAVVLTAPALASGAAAKPRTRVVGGTKWISVELPTKSGWQASVAAVVGGPGGSSEISITANGPGHQSVSYGVHGRVTKHGTIVAKFPGLGRVDVRFEQTAVKKLRDNIEPGCTVPRETLSRKGTFRGRLDIHDPAVLGTIERSATPGTIIDFPAETCPAPKHAPAGGWRRKGEEEESAGSEGFGSDSLYSSRRVDGGNLSFNVTTLEAGGPLGTKSAPRFDFAATFSKRRHGLSTFASASAALAPGGFTVTGPTGAPTEATVEPPAPFHGSAAFKLQSPTSAAWTGDLSVEIPILGEVALAAPGSWATLCDGASCTETLPPGTRFSLLGSD